MDIRERRGGGCERLTLAARDGDITVDTESAEAVRTRGDVVPAFDTFPADNCHRRLLSERNGDQPLPAHVQQNLIVWRVQGSGYAWSDLSPIHSPRPKHDQRFE